MIYSYLNEKLKKLNAFIDDPLTLVVGRPFVVNFDNDLGEGVAGATYVFLTLPIRSRPQYREGYIRTIYTVRLFFGQLYKRNETPANTNEFNDSGANELKILDETEALAKEYLYKIYKDTIVKQVTNELITQAMDVGDTNHTGHYLDFTIEFFENECFGQAEPTPPPPPPDEDEPELPEPLR